MAKRFRLSQIALWLFVVALGVTIGGGLYETPVVMPLWSAAPPDSLIAYYKRNAASYKPN